VSAEKCEQQEQQNKREQQAGRQVASACRVRGNPDAWCKPNHCELRSRSCGSDDQHGPKQIDLDACSDSREDGEQHNRADQIAPAQRRL